MNGSHQFPTLNNGNDKQMRIIQEVDHKADRSIKQPVTDSDATDMTLPDKDTRAGLSLVFNPDGSPGVGGTVAVAEASIANINDGDPDSYVAPDKLAGSKYAAGLKGGVGATFDGAGSVLTTGAKKIYKTIPYDGTITAARLFADQSGDVVVDVWVDSYANFPPTVADTITAAAKPTLSTAQKSEDTTLSGWTVAVTKGQVVEFNIDSVATITKLTIELDIDKTGD
jgi:hypothetical protein